MVIDVSHLRTPFRSGSSLYDFESGICFLDSDRLEDGANLDLEIEAEFTHETAHWLTEALTSTGQFLSFVKSAKGDDVLKATSSSSGFREIVSRRLDTSSATRDRPVFDKWDDFEEWPSEHGAFDVFIEKLLLDVRADAILCHGQTIKARAEFRLATLAHSIGRFSEWLNDYPLLDNKSYTQRSLDKFVRNSIRSGNFSVDPVCSDHYFTTTDLFEAIAVCAEVAWAIRNDYTDTYPARRFETLKGTRYLAPIQEVLKLFDQVLSVQSLTKYVMEITIILSASINPPIPPLETPNYDIFCWEHIFPPSRFINFISSVTHNSGEFEKLKKLSNISFDDTAQKFQDFVYSLMGPPERTFHVHTVENADLNAFNDLPDNCNLNEHGIWIHNDRLLTPYNLRLNSVFQLKMALYNKDVFSLEEAIFRSDLKDMTRYCVPVATLRVGQFEQAPDVVPLNSQILLSSESLSWFLSFTGVQTAALDLLFRPGLIQFGGFIDAFPNIRPSWVTEISRRSEGVWSGLTGTQ